MYFIFNINKTKFKSMKGKWLTGGEKNFKELFNIYKDNSPITYLVQESLSRCIIRVSIFQELQ